MDKYRNAAKAFIVNDNKLLVLRRASNDIQMPDIWELPGGRLGLGENPKEGIKREIKEECGIDIEVLHPMNIRHFTRKDGQIITMLVFLCKGLSDDVRISEEHSGFDWLDLENCKEKLTDFFHEEVDIFNKLELSKHV